MQRKNQRRNMTWSVLDSPKASVKQANAHTGSTKKRSLWLHLQILQGHADRYSSNNASH
jgi:hypothetical protein